MSLKTPFKNVACAMGVERFGLEGVVDGPGTGGSLSTSGPSTFEVVVVVGGGDVVVVVGLPLEFVVEQAPRALIKSSDRRLRANLASRRDDAGGGCPGRIGLVLHLQRQSCRAEGDQGRWPTMARLDLDLRRSGGVAQLEEQLVCNQQVAGSSPVSSTFSKATVLSRTRVTVKILPCVGRRKRVRDVELDVIRLRRARRLFEAGKTVSHTSDNVHSAICFWERRVLISMVTIKTAKTAMPIATENAALYPLTSEPWLALV